MVSRRDRNFEVHYFAARRQLLTLENNERTERNGTENRDFCTFFSVFIILQHFNH